ncbi:rod shape-determining protein MreC [Sphingomicrobium sp. XHP0239]|uniref:rod shape-determining protein MreC n=1 Tax=Sphingomicrobium maritimum TaxID=3133972 RepID=UPI0031CC544F
MAGASKFRRPGWSRRAQYSLFFSFVALGVGLVVGLILLAVSVVAPRTFEGIRGGATDLFSPVTRSLSAVGATTRGLATGAGDYWNAARQNSALREERDELARRALRAEAIERENQQLKEALSLRERSSEPVASGRIVGSSQDSVRRFAILSAGRSDGVRIGMPVRSADGMLGRVVGTGAFSSRLLLVTDRALIVPGRILRTDEPVIARGRGEGTIDLRPLEVGRNPFEPGDIVITSGTGGLYPPLVPLARVLRLDDDGAIAVPIATPAQSSVAIVFPPYEPDSLSGFEAPLTGTE